MKEIIKLIYNFDNFILGVCTIIPAFIQLWISIPDIKKVILKKRIHTIKRMDIFGIWIKITCFIILVFVGLCVIIKNVSTVVPSVEDMSFDNATQTLKELGIKFSSDVHPSNSKEYYVKEQSIDPGNLIWNWETLTLKTEKFESVEQGDGILKLSFYNGRFSYRRSKEEINYLNFNNDIIEQSNCSYLNESTSPTVYITIIDSNGEIYDTKSEHTKECTIPLKYGDYSIQISGDGYQNYTVDVSLRPDNKKSDVWNHAVYLIPNQFMVHDLKIQVIDSDHAVCSSQTIFIGYSGYTLTCETDENGYIEYMFTLSKGDYIVGLENRQGTWFSINEANIDENEITIFLSN